MDDVAYIRTFVMWFALHWLLGFIGVAISFITGITGPIDLC
jgi:uncharacterized membrane protein